MRTMETIKKQLLKNTYNYIKNLAKNNYKYYHDADKEYYIFKDLELISTEARKKYFKGKLY